MYFLGLKSRSKYARNSQDSDKIKNGRNRVFVEKERSYF